MAQNLRITQLGPFSSVKLLSGGAAMEYLMNKWDNRCDNDCKAWKLIARVCKYNE